MTKLHANEHFDLHHGSGEHRLSCCSSARGLHLILLHEEALKEHMDEHETQDAYEQTSKTKMGKTEEEQRDPDEMLARLFYAVTTQDGPYARETLLDIIEDVLDSVKLALETPQSVEQVLSEVRDYVTNHYG